MHEVTQGEWFYTRSGERLGPVGFAELRSKASEGELDPRHDLVWSAGMPDWKPAGEVEGLFERRGGEESEPMQGMAGAPNPYESSLDESVENFMSREGDWPGVKRLGYIFGSILVGVLVQVAPVMLIPMLQPYLGEHTAWLELAIPLLGLVLSIAFVVRRFANLGMSGWWLLGMLVPFLNWWLGYRLFACPPGYAMHRKMDGVGIFLAILYWLAIVAMLVLVAFLVVMFMGAAGSPELQEKFREALEQSRSQT